MRCQVCQKNEVTMKITRLQNGVPTEFNVCDECAPKISPSFQKIRKKNQATKATVENLLKDLLAQAEGAGTELRVEGIAEIPACPECGLEYTRFRQTFMLGCAQCYDAFAERLEADIQKIQGATRHIEGRRSTATRRIDIQARINSLRRELEDSVLNEDFERAAHLRDEIRNLQKSVATHQEGDGA